MTSRVSYCKLIKSETKRRFWYGATLMLIFFCALPLSAMIQFPSKMDLGAMYAGEELSANLSMVKGDVTHFINGGNYGLMILVALVALLGVWTGLSWLHSKRRVDLMCSLPIKREKLFLVQICSDSLLFVVPYLINLLLAVFVIIAKGLLSETVMVSIMSGIGIHVLFYMAFYFCGAVAMMLTGKIATGILGTGVFLTFGPLLSLVLREYPTMYWETYVYNGGFSGILLKYCSPVSTFLMMTERMDMVGLTGNEQGESIIKILLATMVFTILCVVLSFELLKRRKIEAAESAMAFPKTEGIIKAIILYPLLLCGGLFFQMLGTIRTGEHGDFWLWFGVVFTAIFCSILIEVIYHMDRKKLFDHKRWTLGAMVATVGTVVFFQFDLCGYDTWIPEKEEVEMAYAYREINYWHYGDHVNDSVEYIQKYGQKNDVTPVLELAQEGIFYLEAEKGDSFEGRSIDIIYKMRDGTVKKRQYWVSAVSWQGFIKNQFEDEVYRNAMLPIQSADAEKITKFRINIAGIESSMDELSLKEQRECFQIYQEELSSLSYEQLFVPNSGDVEICQGAVSHGRYWTNGPLNENFKKTIAYLEKKGVSLVFKIQEMNIERIEVQRYYQDEVEQDEGIEKLSDVIEIEEINEVKQGLYYDPPFDENRENVEKEEEIIVNVTVLIGEEEQEISAYYKKGEVPEIVRKLLEKAK